MPLETDNMSPAGNIMESDRLSPAATVDPQGHVQVAINLIDFDMNVQEAVEAPRYRILGGRKVALERAISHDVRHALQAMGHELFPYGELPPGTPYGGGQAILIDRERGVLLGGSDHRKDGCAIGY